MHFYHQLASNHWSQIPQMKIHCHIILIITAIFMMTVGLLSLKLIPGYWMYAGERNRRRSGKSGRREGEVRLLLFSRQTNGSRKANFFLYAASVRHISHYSLWYSSLDFENQNKKFSHEIVIISNKLLVAFWG